MNREKLINEVKDEYAKLSERSSKDNFIDKTSTSINNEKYYEKLLQKVISCIEEGRFDHCKNGGEIIELAANDKSILY